MADLAVHGATKDYQGDITVLCGPWGSASASASSVIQSIQLGNRYYVPLTDGTKAWIAVVRGGRRSYLRTNWDGTTKNNLDDLPPC
jgi:ATP-dependent Lon protease